MVRASTAAFAGHFQRHGITCTSTSSAPGRRDRTAAEREVGHACKVALPACKLHYSKRQYLPINWMPVKRAMRASSNLSDRRPR